MLYLAANSSALDQANGSIGFVGGAAGRCLGYKHSPILAKSKPLWEFKIDFWLTLWDHIENPGFHTNKINILPTPNRQNRLFLVTIQVGLMHFVQMVLNFDKMLRKINHDLQDADGV